MPDAKPTINEAYRARVSPGISVSSSAAPAIVSGSGSTAGLSGSSESHPLFLASFRSTYLQRTGESYAPHFDDINEPTFTPSTTEEDVIAGSTLSQINPASGDVTMFIGLFEDLTETQVSLPVPAGTVAALQVRASAAPGTGKSFTYTLMKNGVAQSMAVAVSGSDQSGTTSTNQVSCSVGDRISLRLVADSGASAASHRFTVRYTVTT